MAIEETADSVVARMASPPMLLEKVVASGYEKEGATQGVNRKSEHSHTQDTQCEVALTIVLPSGKELAKVIAAPSWTGADVLSSVQQHVCESKCLQGLLVGARLISGAETVEQLGLSSGTILQAVMQGVPTLHLNSPCSAVALPDRYEEWLTIFGENVIDESLQHRSMGYAPEVACKVAETLAEAFGDQLQE